MGSQNSRWCAAKGMGCLFIAIYFAGASRAQTTLVIDSPSLRQKTVIAGAEYQKSSLYRWLWGADYRKEWITPVRIPVLNLDTTFGGMSLLSLHTEETATRTLLLKDARGRRYILRKVNKTYLGNLPLTVKGTFVENLANDQIASNHPFAALSIPHMAEAAGVYHTNPRYVVVPRSPKLGSFNREFANSLCLLEEYPDRTQTGQMDFGKGNTIVSTEQMMENVLKDPAHVVDQHSYMKTRLFDMLIGDWGRYKENWRWSLFDSGRLKMYRPVPTNRDQTYAQFEGSLLSLVISIGKFKELQTFDDEIKNIKWYNYPAFDIDKRFTNALSRHDWVDSARALANHLTDEVIEAAIRQMPPEIFDISGEDIVKKLKKRRDNLAGYAEEYYRFLSKDVEIPGTSMNEVFEVQRLSDDETAVSIYQQHDRTRPVYSRRFKTKETKEIRIYGIGGRDAFLLSGTVNEGIKIKLIGGPDKDTLIDRSSVKGMSRRTRFYDNPGNVIDGSDETAAHLSRFPSINRYDYEVFKYDSRGIKPVFYYNTFYRFYVGIGYSFTKNKTKEGGFSAKHSVGLNYSIIERSFHPYYRGTFNELLGRWNLNVSGGYDEVRRFNYFGLGNETAAITDDISFYWLRLKNLYGSAGVDQTFMDRHNVKLDFIYNAIKVINHDGRFVSKENFPLDHFQWKHFGSAQLGYTYIKANDRVIPTKGVYFQAAGSYTRNFYDNSRSFTRTSTSLGVYLPIYKPFSLAVKAGGATLWGEPEFYQYNHIGGYFNLRGFWRYRFYGKTSAHIQNEIRWLPEVKGHFYSGKIGLMAFFDQGRVWHPGQKSDRWHYGYGGGFIIVPFNKMAIAVTYGLSDEGRRTNLRLGKFL